MQHFNFRKSYSEGVQAGQRRGCSRGGRGEAQHQALREGPRLGGVVRHAAQVHPHACAENTGGNCTCAPAKCSSRVWPALSAANDHLPSGGNLLICKTRRSSSMAVSCIRQHASCCHAAHGAAEWTVAPASPQVSRTTACSRVFPSSQKPARHASRIFFWSRQSLEQHQAAQESHVQPSLIGAATTGERDTR
jgi:hypothetical protein